ncbi:MAG: hypothetical protein WC475_02200 [Candidatus Paceibacterota bacterium]
MDLIIFLLIWLVIYKILYSPEARIRIIWRQIYRIPIKIARVKKDFPDKANYFDEGCEKALSIRYKMIIALLSYHFDPEEDKEYISKNIERIPYNYRPQKMD